MEIRHAQPSDYGRVIGRVNAWWGGRDMAPMLPKLFFVHFEGTSFVIDDDEGQLAGFLIGFLSQTEPEEAYIHFVGVAPERSRRGARTGAVRALLRRGPGARTRAGALRDLAGEHELGRVPREARLRGRRVAEEYDGPGEDRVLLVKQLD